VSRPDVCPHPDDIHIDGETLEVTINGAANPDEKAAQDEVVAVRDDCIKQLEQAPSLEVFTEYDVDRLLEFADEIPPLNSKLPRRLRRMPAFGKGRPSATGEDAARADLFRSAIDYAFFGRRQLARERLMKLVREPGPLATGLDEPLGGGGGGLEHDVRVDEEPGEGQHEATEEELAALIKLRDRHIDAADRLVERGLVDERFHEHMSWLAILNGQLPRTFGQAPTTIKSILPASVVSIETFLMTRPGTSGLTRSPAWSRACCLGAAATEQ
jgi:hypothetical protein